MSIRRAITATRLKGFDAPTVWAEFTPLSNKFASVNLGQGFPDWEAPTFAKEAMIKAINDNHNQYTRTEGDVKLVTALADIYGPMVGREINPLTEVTVSVGATEALFSIMQAYINEGDEVVVLEPTFDIYPAQVQMAGGVCKYVPLRLNESKTTWVLDMEELEAAITPKTKLMIINTPHNPTGKVMTIDELQSIRDILMRHEHVTAVTDEVYEFLVYGGRTHHRLASLPDMWNRTITVSSCGKTFSTTGWKVGYCYGAAHLIKPVTAANQWIQYCVSTPTQKAIADMLLQSLKPYEGADSYYAYIRGVYEKKMNALVDSLNAVNLNPIAPEAGFFVMSDTSLHEVPKKYFEQPAPDGSAPTRDWAFARWFTEDVGITPIPPSAFYTDDRKELAANLARFAFCKQDKTLVEAHKRFMALASKGQK